jgi:hypothetical protein
VQGFASILRVDKDVVRRHAGLVAIVHDLISRFNMPGEAIDIKQGMSEAIGGQFSPNAP